MASSLLLKFRLLHRKLASVLFIFFFIIAATGLLLGMKTFFTKTIYDSENKKTAIKLSQVLPLDSLDKLATTNINKYTNSNYTNTEKLEVRPSKGLSVAYFKDNYTVQLAAETGKLILIEQKKLGIIQDIHDGAIIGNIFSNKAGGTAKIIYSLIMGISLLIMTSTGFYLYYKPKQIKNVKK